MSDELDQDLRDFRSAFPRPSDSLTSSFEEQIRYRVSRPRRPVPVIAGAAAVIALALGAALGAAGVIVVSAGAATEYVALNVRPLIVGNIPATTAFGSVSNGAANEDVNLEIRECGASAFSVIEVVRTSSGGAYSVQVGWFKNGVIRARWGDQTSDEVEVQKRVTMTIDRLGLSRSRFEVVAIAPDYLRGKRARVERWDRATGRWLLAKRVTLQAEGRVGGQVGSNARFRLRVGRGVQLRAVLPQEQARPCYAEGVSRIFTT